MTRSTLTSRIRLPQVPSVLKTLANVRDNISAVETSVEGVCTIVGILAYRIKILFVLVSVLLCMIVISIIYSVAGLSGIRKELGDVQKCGGPRPSYNPLGSAVAMSEHFTQGGLGDPSADSGNQPRAQASRDADSTA